MTVTQDSANEFAQSAEVGIFGIDDVLILAEIAYYVFSLWKTCAPAVSANVYVSSQIQDDGSVPTSLVRRSRRAVRRAARKKGQSLTSDQIDNLTTQLLMKVAQSPTDVVVACSAEPCDVAMEAEGEFDDAADE